jgi:hypothetical protein
MNRLFKPRGRPGNGPEQGPTHRRRAHWLAIAAAITLPVALVTAPLALAGTVPPFTIGPNGQAVVPGADGAINLQDLSGNVKELGPENSSTTKIGVIHNDALPTLGLTNPNAQVDLRQAWLGAAKDADQDDWVYFAWERDSNNGSGFIAFEFMQNKAPVACAFGPNQDEAALIANCNPWKNRVGDDDGAGPHIGDFMIFWDQQGGSRDLYLRRWIGTAPNLTLTAPVLIPSTVGVAAYSQDGFRGEAAVNITDAIFGGVATCLAFANVIPSTVTGNSDTADYKDTILTSGVNLSNCTTTTVTTPKLVSGGSTTNFPAAGTSITTAGVLEVKDSALITLVGGSSPAGGSVDFTLCKASNVANATCDAGGPSALVGDDVAVSGSYPVTVSSPSAWVTSAGRYCWKAVYTPAAGSGIGGSDDVTPGECFTVTPVTPQLSTSAGPDVNLGTAITDTASLTGTAPKPTAAVIETTAPNPANRVAAGGTIAFTLFGPATGSCGPQITAANQSVNVTGDNTAYGPASFTPSAPGDYHWKASYSGDSPNTTSASHNANCTETGEDVTVNTVPSSLFTEQEWVPNDSATVSAPAGTGNLAGSVTFTLYPSSDCTGTPVFPSATVPVAGASPQKVSTSNTTKVTASGSFSWKVSYDSTNAAQRDIPDSCHETSGLTITNGGTISSP